MLEITVYKPAFKISMWVLAAARHPPPPLWCAIAMGILYNDLRGSENWSFALRYLQEGIYCWS